MERKTVSTPTRNNRLLDAGLFASALAVTASSIYFLYALSGSSHGGANPDPMFLFSRATWDLLHTWSGVGMILAAEVHFVIHWRWVVKVTAKVFESLLPNLAWFQPRPAAQ